MKWRAGLRTGRKRYAPREVTDIAWLIDLFLDRHVLGLAILVGTVPFPPSEEIAAMVRNSVTYDDVRVKGGEKLPEQQRVVEAVTRVDRAVALAGGIEQINREFRNLREKMPDDYRLLREYTENVRSGRPASLGAASATDIADRHNMHPDTLRRVRNYIVLSVAIALAESDGRFALHG